jgi:hypothetical protein
MKRQFNSEDGRTWEVAIDATPGQPDHAPRAGWEMVLYLDRSRPDATRLVFRPTGWLAEAGDEELRRALREAVPVRASWGIRAT